jgi:hypothetical protein
LQAIRFSRSLFFPSVLLSAAPLTSRRRFIAAAPSENPTPFAIIAPIGGKCGLVDYDPPAAVNELGNPHYTIGGPYFNDYRDCGHAELWLAEGDDMLRRDRRSQ